MRVVFYTYGGELVPSSRTRVFQFLPHLRKHGVSAKIIALHTDLALRLRIAWSPRSALGKAVFEQVQRGIYALDAVHGVLADVRFLIAARSADVIVIQKIRVSAFVLARLEAAGTPIAFDIDDAIFLDFTPAQRAKWDRQWRLVRLGTVENDFNAQIFRDGTRILKMIGPIDCDRYRPNPAPSVKIVIGWVGSGSSTPFLELIKEPLQRLVAEFPELELWAVGASRLEWTSDRIKVIPWTLAGEQALLQQFSIGLMPLADEPWALGKGGYKILQYMALGIPSVVSPFGVNAELVVEGETGLWARTADDWYAQLRALITDERLRRAIGAKAREVAETTYSFESYTPQLVAEYARLAEAGAVAAPASSTTAAVLG